MDAGQTVSGRPPGDDRRCRTRSRKGGWPDQRQFPACRPVKAGEPRFKAGDRAGLDEWTVDREGSRVRCADSRATWNWCLRAWAATSHCSPSSAPATAWKRQQKAG